MSELIVEVCKINKVERHPNADRLDIATVKGWNCIVGRDEFKEGDLCVYIPIDAILPDGLEKVLFSGTKVKLKNHRVRTIKLRGVVSQGLVISVSRAAEYAQSAHADKRQLWDEGTDVAGLLDITKYQPPVKSMPNQMSGNRAPKKHVHPDFLKYTDINHYRNFPSMLEGKVCSVTEKIHGTNFRCGWLPWVPRTFFDKLKNYFWPFSKRWEFVFGSHNVQLQDGSRKQFYDTNVYARIVKDHNLKARLEPWKGFIFYGEIFGSGIQSGYEYGMGPNEIDVRWFDIRKVFDGKFFDYNILKAVCSTIGLDVVPELYVGPVDGSSIDQWCSGPSRISLDQKFREGCVIKSITEFNGHGGRSILKLLNPDYLLLKDNSSWH